MAAHLRESQVTIVEKRCGGVTIHGHHLYPLPFGWGQQWGMQMAIPGNCTVYPFCHPIEHEGAMNGASSWHPPPAPPLPLPPLPLVHPLACPLAHPLACPLECPLECPLAHPLCIHQRIDLRVHFCLPFP